MSKYKIIFEGFSSPEEVERFINWYSYQGEQIRYEDLDINGYTDDICNINNTITFPLKCINDTYTVYLEK